MSYQHPVKRTGIGVFFVLFQKHFMASEVWMFATLLGVIEGEKTV